MKKYVNVDQARKVIFINLPKFLRWVGKIVAVIIRK